jgi:plasmid maintenance system antidote protein VapI
MKKELTDKEILLAIMEEYGLKANALARKLEYVSAQTVYNIIKDKYGRSMTPDMELRLLDKFPDLRKEFVTRGQKPVLKSQVGTFVRNVSDEAYSVREHLFRLEAKLDAILDRLN